MSYMSQEKLAEIFGKFANKEVATYTENDVIVPFPNSPLLAEMDRVAKENNLMLNIRYPGVMYNSLAMEGRVTVQLSQGFGNKCRVARISLG